MCPPETETPIVGNAGLAAAKDDASLTRYLLYTLSLPERLVRSTVGVTAGAAHETAHALVPQAFKSSKSYELVVTKSLGFLTDSVGGVESATPQTVTADGADQYLARKAVGNFVDLAGLATLHLSPIWLFAIVSDVAYGSKAYLHELAAELQQQGLIKNSSAINRVDDLLEAVRAASAETASLFDTPPLSLEQLKLSLERTRTAIVSSNNVAILPKDEIDAQWKQMRAISTGENVSLLGVSGALTMHMLGKAGTVAQGTMTGLQVAGGLLNRNVVDHYKDALRMVHEQGFYPLIRESSAPYVKAVWTNFTPDRATWTAQLASGALFRQMWTAIRGRFSSRPAAPASDAPSKLAR